MRYKPFHPCPVESCDRGPFYSKLRKEYHLIDAHPLAANVNSPDDAEIATLN